MPADEGITVLLRAWRDGDRSAEERLFELMLPDLRRIAGWCISRERPGHTVQPTELIGQIYERLVRAKDRDWQTRREFYGIAARAMRHYLIDYARARHGEPVRLELIEGALPIVFDFDTALEVDGVLDRLARERPECAAAVELKYFLGLTDGEAAEAMGVPLRRFQRLWHDARGWLFDQLNAPRGA